MRAIAILASFMLLPLGSACGVYYSYGESLLPYQGHALHRTGEVQIGVTRPQFARWSVGIDYTAALSLDSGAFFDPNCFSTAKEIRAHKAVGCHPHIISTSAALEVQHRWFAARSLRPVMSMNVGSITNKYGYHTFAPNVAIDSAQSSPFITVRGGAEYSVTSWLHLAVLGGYRAASRQTTVSRTASNSGLALTSSFTIGKRYQR
jgi:hypothetical protein